MRGLELQRVGDAEDDHDRHELPADAALRDGARRAAAGRHRQDVHLHRARLAAARPHNLGARPQADWRRLASFNFNQMMNILSEIKNIIIYFLTRQANWFPHSDE